MITTKIEIKSHLAEYISGKYGEVDCSVICFPDKLDIYHTIYDLLEKRPSDVGLDFGNLEIMLPERYNGKKTSTFNYLGKRSVKILEKKIENMFWAELHDFLDERKHRLGDTYKDSVYFFVVKYNLDSITEDALLKNYSRWKDNIRKRKVRRKYNKSLQQNS